MGVHSGSPAEALDDIRAGGNKLLLTARQRLHETEVALDHGRFEEAFTVATSLHEKLGILAQASAALGRLRDAAVVRVSLLQPGMRVLDAGIVMEVAGCGCEREGCENLTVRFENGHEVTLDRDLELVVAA